MKHDGVTIQLLIVNYYNILLHTLVSTQRNQIKIIILPPYKQECTLESMQNDDSITLLSRKRLKVNFFGSIRKNFYFNRPKPTIRIRLIISERAEAFFESLIDYCRLKLHALQKSLFE